MNSFSTRDIEKMREVLMDPKAKGPDVFYYMIRGGEDKGNITVIESGTVGGEYIKTYGHYHILDFVETYTVLYGEGILLIQVRKKVSGELINNKIESFQALRIKAGDKIKIPPFSGHLLINTGKTWMVTHDQSPFGANEDSSAPAHADYETVKNMHGFAYFVVEENGQPKLVKNPAYESVPEVAITDFNSESNHG